MAHTATQNALSGDPTVVADENTSELLDLLGLGPTDGTAPGGGGSLRAGAPNFSAPRSNHYYLERTQEQAKSDRDSTKFDGWNFNETYYAKADGSGATLFPTPDPSSEEG